MEGAIICRFEVIYLRRLLKDLRLLHRRAISIFSAWLAWLSYCRGAVEGVLVSVEIRRAGSPPGKPLDREMLSGEMGWPKRVRKHEEGLFARP